MNDAFRFPGAVPTRTRVSGRVSITYSRLKSPWLVHGTVVFKDPGYESRDSSWRRLVKDFVMADIGPAPRKVVIPVQVHAGKVMRVGAGIRHDTVETGGPEAPAGDEGSVYAPTCDGLVTSDCGIVIGVNTADCIPLMAVNESARVIGVAHCGWRGISAGIVENLLKELDSLAGADSRGAARFLIGPSVGACCYEVGADFLGSFSELEVRECSVTADGLEAGGRTAFDLRRLVGMRLVNAGIDRDSVFTDNTCTSCQSDALSSYRAEGEACGRMYTYLMITG
ncbi:MAG: polyphenol oxidase family protein [bacterium]